VKYPTSRRDPSRAPADDESPSAPYRSTSSDDRGLESPSKIKERFFFKLSIKELASLFKHFISI
jgi:hypothetical protein